MLNSLPLNHSRLNTFLQQLTQKVEDETVAAHLLAEKIKPLLSELVRYDDWLVETFSSTTSQNIINNIFYIVTSGNAFQWWLLSGGQAKRHLFMIIKFGG